MIESRIGRLNELARKHKAEGLNEEELAERAVLREEYLASIRNSLESQLGQMYFVEADGSKTKVEKKTE